MAMSYLQAYDAKQRGRISWDDYIRILLSRCTGAKHEEDGAEGTFPKLRRIDPFGHHIWMWSNRIGTIKDAGPLEDVFQGYCYKTLEDVKHKLNSLQGIPNEGIQGVKKSLALLACKDRRRDVLKFYLDQGGFPIEATMNG